MEKKTKIDLLAIQMGSEIGNLEANIKKVQNTNVDNLEKAKLWRDEVLTSMKCLRKTVDTAESMVAEENWPIPTYIDLLFGI